MQFAIIGVGVFGKTCAKELQSQGNHVLAIDIDEKLIDEIAPEVSRAVIADATSAEVLAELGLADFDGVLVAIGDNLEANLLCTLELLKIGASNLWVKAKTDAHHQILQSLGITNIIHPEQDMGIKIAQNMSYPVMKQYIAFGDDDYAISINPPTAWHGKSWQQIRRQEKVMLCVAKRDGELYDADDNWVIEAGDKIIAVGTRAALRVLVKGAHKES